MKLILHLIFAAALAMPTALAAYDGGGYGGSGQLSNATTNKLVKLLTGGVRGCQRFDKVYRYDCYRQVYAQAARSLDRSGAYGPARKILAGVEASLEQTISRNADPTQKQLRRGLTRLRPIKPAAVPGAKQEFITALDRAETQLLRSADRSGDHYVRIAQALNSNKLLLRAAYLLLPRPALAALGLAVPPVG